MLLARTYLQLLDNKAAELEYSNCMKCNPFSAVGHMAHQESINIAGRSAAEKACPTDDLNTVSKSVDAINREANELKGSYGTASNTNTPTYANSYPGGAYPGYTAGSNASRSSATFSNGMPLNSTQPSANGTYGKPGMSAMYGRPGGPPGYAGQPSPAGQPGVPYGFPTSGVYNPTAMTPGTMGMPNHFNQTPPLSTNLRVGRGRSFSNMASFYDPTQQSWSYYSSDYQVQQMRRQQANVQAAQYAQDSANNLERLMAEKQNGSTPKLRALGTNLFVHYYGSHDQDGSTASIPPADPMPELKAKPLKLSDMK